MTIDPRDLRDADTLRQLGRDVPGIGSVLGPAGRAAAMRHERDDALAERDAARDLAVYAMSLVDWSTPSWRVNPDDPAGVIALRGYAIFEPDERNHP